MKVIIKVENASLIPLNKAQNLNVEVVYENQMKNSVGSTYNYSMTVKK